MLLMIDVDGDSSQGGVRGGTAELLHPFQLLGGAGQGPGAGGARGGAVV